MALLCLSCQLESAETAKFCESCGADLVRVCSHCGQHISPAARFCSACGTRTAESLSVRATAPAAREAERRQLTLMFCDLVGSTALSEELDPEDLREVIRAYQKVCSEVIEEYGGYVAQYLGDGLLVYFGFPRAYEDSAWRAVSSGLRLLEAMKVLNEGLQASRGLRLAVRVGLHTGMVVIGDIGGPGRAESLALGGAPNLAARIQALADPDTVLISGVTRQLIARRFRFKDLGWRLLKGIERPVQIFQVLEEEATGPQAAIHLRRAALVGRDDEGERLIRCWQETREGQGRVALVSGEPGIGKSRLIQLLLDQVAGEPDARQWVLRCFSLHQQSALHPLLDLLHQALQLGKTGSMEEKLASLKELLEVDDDDSGEQALGVFAALFSLPMPGGTAAASVNPYKQREMIHAALASWFVRQAARRPLLIVWEDLHWADPSSLDVLLHLLANLRDSRILLVLSFRSDFEPPWTDDPSWEHLNLRRLSREEARRLVSGVTGGKSLPRELVQRLIAQTDGVPLFLEELTRMVLESDWLREAADRYELEGPLPALAIPTTLYDSLMARLDRFSTVKAVLQVAAVLGREFTYRMISSVSPVEEEDLAQDLGYLTDAGLLDREGALPRARYAFRHALIQEAAYDSLLKARRQQFHARIAKVLDEESESVAERAEDLGRLAVLAHHWSRAIDPQRPDSELVHKAVGYLHRVGAEALRLSAYQEARTHFEESLRWITALPAGRQRSEAELGTQVLRSLVLKVLLGWAAPEVKQAFDRAHDLCLELGDRPELPQVIFGLGGYHLTLGEHRRAFGISQELLELGRRMDDSDLLLEAHCALSNTHFWLGELPQAIDHGLRTLELFDPERHATHLLRYGQDPRVIAMQICIWSLGIMDRSKEASALEAEMAVMTERFAHPFSTAIALLTAQVSHQIRNEPEGALAAAEELIRLAQEMDFPPYEISGEITREWALAKSGRAEEAAGRIGHKRETFLTLGELAATFITNLAAEVLQSAGWLREGIEMAADGLRRARTNGEVAYEANLCCLHGEMLAEVAEGSADPSVASYRSRAETSLRQALTLAGERRQAVFASRAARALCSLLDSQGRSEEAAAVQAELQTLLQDCARCIEPLLARMACLGGSTRHERSGSSESLIHT